MICTPGRARDWVRFGEVITALKRRSATESRALARRSRALARFHCARSHRERDQAALMYRRIVSFEDRLRAATDEQLQNAQAADTAAQVEIEKTNQARQNAVAMLPEVRTAVMAVQALSAPGSHDATRLENGTALHGNGWSVYRETEAQKKSFRRSAFVVRWDFAIGHTAGATFRVGATGCSVTYRTDAIASGSPRLMTVEEFADLGRVTWSDGNYMDAHWQSGSILVSAEFDMFLTAAAALVAKLTT